MYFGTRPHSHRQTLTKGCARRRMLDKAINASLTCLRFPKHQFNKANWIDRLLPPEVRVDCRVIGGRMAHVFSTKFKFVVALSLAGVVTSALADINVGVTLSTTGPTASLGIPEKNTIALLPKSIDGQKVNYIVLDDAPDPTAASKNARKLVSEDKVDVIIGSTATPTSTAVLEVAAESRTPQIALAPFAPPADHAAWGVP